MTQRQKQQQGTTAQTSDSTPQHGEKYRCEECGMALEITADCHCEHPENVHLECCGARMIRD